MGKKNKQNKKNKTGGGGISSFHSPEIIAGHYKHLHSQKEERCRIGSSYNSSRTNSEANRIANQARVYKKANNLSQAYDLYTEAIHLDPYNHFYFHHRAETNLNAGRYELAMWDAQFGLDLCVKNSARWGQDECFSLLWCTLTRSCLELRQFWKAKRYCETGLMTIKEEEYTLFALKVLCDYNTEIKYILRNLPTDYERVFIKNIENEGDSLSYRYTLKVASSETPPRDVAPNQPEFIIVDTIQSMPVKETFDHVFNKLVPGWTSDPDSLERDDGKVFQVSGNGAGTYWATIIPVRDDEERCMIQRCLMLDCMENSKIVILKLVKSKKAPTVGNTAEYVASIAKNARNLEAIYSRGHKVAIDTKEIIAPPSDGLLMKARKWWMPISIVLVANILYYYWK